MIHHVFSCSYAQRRLQVRPEHDSRQRFSSHLDACRAGQQTPPTWMLCSQSPDSEPPSTVPPLLNTHTHTKKLGPSPQKEVISRYTNPHNLPAQQKPIGQFWFPVPPLSTRLFEIKCPIITQFPLKTHRPTSSLADNCQRLLSTAQDS